MNLSEAALTCDLCLLFVTSSVSGVGKLNRHLIDTSRMEVLLTFSDAFHISFGFVAVSANLSVSLLDLRRPNHHRRMLSPLLGDIRHRICGAFRDFLRLLLDMHPWCLKHPRYELSLLLNVSCNIGRILHERWLAAHSSRGIVLLSRRSHLQLRGDHGLHEPRPDRIWR